jgi:hypothetical protein
VQNFFPDESLNVWTQWSSRLEKGDAEIVSSQPRDTERYSGMNKQVVDRENVFSHLSFRDYHFHLGVLRAQSKFSQVQYQEVNGKGHPIGRF